MDGFTDDVCAKREFVKSRAIMNVCTKREFAISKTIMNNTIKYNNL